MASLMPLNNPLICGDGTGTNERKIYAVLKILYGFDHCRVLFGFSSSINGQQGRLSNPNSPFKGADQSAAGSTIKPINKPLNHAEKKIMIYPNPASGEVSLVFSATSDCKATLDVFRINGEIVGSVMKADVKKDVTINETFQTAEWTEGIYFVRLILGDEVVIKKLIILKK